MWFVLEALTGMSHDLRQEAGSRLADDLTDLLPAASVKLVSMPPA